MKRIYDKNGNELSMDEIDLSQGTLEIELTYQDEPFELGKVYDSSIKELEEVYVFYPYRKNQLTLQEIGQIKDMLKKTDYVDNKLIEAFILGNFEEMKAKYALKLQERQALRDRINELEAKIIIDEEELSEDA